jgi:succinate dehydrogenase/fumarate reductase flavoprotein subunit
MTAHARWMYTAALARDESRGLHRLAGRETDERFTHRILTGGLDELWTAPDVPLEMVPQMSWDPVHPLPGRPL